MASRSRRAEIDRAAVLEWAFAGNLTTKLQTPALKCNAREFRPPLCFVYIHQQLTYYH
jgi:hypothetical protein